MSACEYLLQGAPGAEVPGSTARARVDGGPWVEYRECGLPTNSVLAARLGPGPWVDFGVCPDHVLDLVDDLVMTGFTVDGDWDV